MSKIEIFRKSTQEANVSGRAVWFDVHVDGEYVTSFDDVVEAMEYKERLEQG